MSVISLRFCFLFLVVRFWWSWSFFRLVNRIDLVVVVFLWRVVLGVGNYFVVFDLRVW